MFERARDAAVEPSPAAWLEESSWALPAIVASAVGIRLLFARLIDPRALSVDFRAWVAVADELGAGRNPYVTTPFLNWPPVWMTVVFAAARIAAATGTTIVRMLQLFLVVGDAGLLVATDRLMERLAVPRRHLLLLVGIALNPVSILLTCQHGSFDGLVALVILLFLLAMFRFLESDDAVSWLAAMLFLGIGTALKSIPIVLTPLAAAGIRRRTFRQVALGAVLLGLPTVAGLSVIFALGPAEVTAHVLHYRSLPGWFGWTGLLHGIGRDDLIVVWAKTFPVILLSGMALATVLIGRSRAVTRRELVLWSLLFLIAIPLFGSGYGPQYVLWFWPLLLAAAPGGSRWLQAAVGGFIAAASATYLFEYGLMESLGGFLLWRNPGAAVVLTAVLLRSIKAATLVNAPLFLAYGAVFFAAAGDLIRLRRGR